MYSTPNSGQDQEAIKCTSWREIVHIRKRPYFPKKNWNSVPLFKNNELIQEKRKKKRKKTIVIEPKIN